MKAIRVHTPGPEENLILEEVATPEPGPGQALVKLAASGVNFIDIYFRTGLYPAPEKPFGLGMEAAGTVVAVGPDTTHVKVGDRVAYAMQRGSYAEYAVVPSWMLVPVPDALDLPVAAALMLQGMTVHYLTHGTFLLAAGQTCLIHAAAGGVGLILTQVAKLLGAKVIAFQGSLNSLRPRGMMVTFGNASGPVPAIEPLLLSQKGSLFLTRPRLGDYCLNREEVLERATTVFGWKLNDHLPVFSTRTYPLAQAGQAQRDLASRTTSGKLLLNIA